MTKAQMQAVVTAITNAGYEAQAIPDVNTNPITWRVRARASDFSVPASTLNTLATAQGVNVKVAEAQFD